MNRLEQWLEENFDRRVRIFPSNHALRTEYVTYRPKNGAPARFTPDAESQFSVRRVTVIAASLMLAALPWFVPIVYLLS